MQVRTAEYDIQLLIFFSKRNTSKVVILIRFHLEGVCASYSNDDILIPVCYSGRSSNSLNGNGVSKSVVAIANSNLHIYNP